MVVFCSSLLKTLFTLLYPILCMVGILITMVMMLFTDCLWLQVEKRGNICLFGQTKDPIKQETSFLLTLMFRTINFKREFICHLSWRRICRFNGYKPRGFQSIMYWLFNMFTRILPLKKERN